jgi:hypothetical protein
MPLLLVLRYRAGAVCRRGRRRVVTLNLVMIPLHAQPLADIDHHPGCDGAIALRGLANLAWMARVRVR